MRWITRVFVSAAVRRVAAICVLALLGWLGIGTARAQSSYPSQGLAYQACASDLAGVGNRVVHQGCEQVGDYYYCTVWTGPGASGSTRSCGTFSGTLRGQYYGWPAGKTCGNEAQQTGKPWQSQVTDIRDGTISCESGCETAWFSNGDGTSTGMPVGSVCQSFDPKMCDMYPGMYWNSKVNACEPPEVETCPEGQAKNANGNCENQTCPAGMVESPGGTCINEKNECPAGDVKSPTGECLPGEGKCAAGEARGKDGTCKRDSDGDGTPDNEDDDPSNDDNEEKFSGGDNCDSPPSCSGSPIQCGQARIQWRIECNTRRNVNISGGACNAMPVCTGKECNAMEYSQLLQQWRTTCAVEKLAAMGQGGGAPGDNSDLIAYLNSGGTFNSDALGDGGIEVGDPWGGGGGQPGDEHEPDGSGFGYSTSCPTFPTVNVMGTVLDFNGGPLCDWLALGGQLVLILAALASLRIVAGSAA